MNALIKRDILFVSPKLSPILHDAPPALGTGEYARILKPNDSPNFRSVRLEALQEDGRCFATSYEKEKSYPDNYWEQMCVEAKDRCVIGVFDETDLIGITVVSKWSGDQTGKTALFGSSYIKSEYRGRGLSTLLYGGRIEWAKQKSQFDTAVVFHRNGNYISEAINKKHGAQYWENKSMDWADGNNDTGYWYQIKLRA